ncbi:predicted protein [Botrytis cinerea T4]|uniref:Uncharacterized protein n=1 Tax=Botryotinia fuckeliana (strain T4) TaxID=999810 RepID=G2YU05_BOTF4|nr:predicted protein [Botrytis cinerea T4]
MSWKKDRRSTSASVKDLDARTSPMLTRCGMSGYKTTARTCVPLSHFGRRIPCTAGWLSEHTWGPKLVRSRWSYLGGDEAKRNMQGHHDFLTI